MLKLCQNHQAILSVRINLSDISSNVRSNRVEARVGRGIVDVQTVARHTLGRGFRRCVPIIYGSAVQHTVGDLVGRVLIEIGAAAWRLCRQREAGAHLIDTTVFRYESFDPGAFSAGCLAEHLALLRQAGARAGVI